MCIAELSQDNHLRNVLTMPRAITEEEKNASMKMNRKQALKQMVIGSAGIWAMPLTANAEKSVAGNMTYEASRPITEIDQATHWRNAALIIVDMQNDFVRVGAPLEVPAARDTIGRTKELIAAFRKRNLPIVFTKFISHPHYYMLWDWSPQCQPPTKCCWKNFQRSYRDVSGERECTDIIDELQPGKEDIVIEKFGYGAFHDTPLERVLRSAGYNSVVITGTVTQICVEETAREAFHYGFRTTIVEDAVSSFAPDLHAATLKNFNMKFGWVTKSESILSKLV